VTILHKSAGLLFHSRSPVRVAASSTFSHQNAFAPGLRGLVFLGLLSLKENGFLLGINFDFSL
jgi:hypothetical protein